MIIALEGESALRFLTGLLTIFLAFYIESTRHGFDAAAALGAVLGAAGVGNFLGTAAGARITLRRPGPGRDRLHRGRRGRLPAERA